MLRPLPYRLKLIYRRGASNSSVEVLLEAAPIGSWATRETRLFKEDADGISRVIACLDCLKKAYLGRLETGVCRLIEEHALTRYVERQARAFACYQDRPAGRDRLS